jgi:glycine oxidase
MKRLSNQDIVVVGSGALGSACALTTAQAGARVTLIDNAALAANASGIAAGMLAPAFESALDSVSAGQFAMLAAARDLWPAFVEGIGPVGLDRCGALLDAPDEVLNDVWTRLAAQGARVEEAQGQLFTPDDWRLEPRLALAAMRQALRAAGGRIIHGQVAAVESGEARLISGERVGFDAIILACGFGGQALAPELAVLTPIKGQLLRYVEAGPRDGAILRNTRGYLAPGMTGAVVGATMEEGRSDLAVDSMATERLRAQAARLAPGLAGAKVEPFTGVRAATPDGLPLIGRSMKDGVWLAAGARRNGWLFAPLAAQLIVAGLEGNEGGVWESAAFAPHRFSMVSARVEHDRDTNL